MPGAGSGARLPREEGVGRSERAGFLIWAGLHRKTSYEPAIQPISDRRSVGAMESRIPSESIEAFGRFCRTCGGLFSGVSL